MDDPFLNTYRTSINDDMFRNNPELLFDMRLVMLLQHLMRRGNVQGDKDNKDTKDNGTNPKEQKKTEVSDIVAMGFGVELSVFLYSINIGFFGGYGTGLGSGGIVITFTSGASNNLSFNGYGALVQGNTNTYKVTDMKGSGGEWSLGLKFISFTRASNNLSDPNYIINQVGIGKVKFNPTGSALSTKTIVIPTFNLLFGSPFL